MQSLNCLIFFCLKYNAAFLFISLNVLLSDNITGQFLRILSSDGSPKDSICDEFMLKSDFS